jgi:hypothetical protein
MFITVFTSARFFCLPEARSIRSTSPSYLWNTHFNIILSFMKMKFVTYAHRTSLITKATITHFREQLFNESWDNMYLHVINDILMLCFEYLSENIWSKFSHYIYIYIYIYNVRNNGWITNDIKAFYLGKRSLYILNRNCNDWKYKLHYNRCCAIIRRV